MNLAGISAQFCNTPDSQATILHKDDCEEKITELVDLRLVNWTLPDIHNVHPTSSA